MMILKKIAKLLFNRVFYVIFAMAVQLGWLLTIFLRLAGYSRYMSFILDVISIPGCSENCESKDKPLV